LCRCRASAPARAAALPPHGGVGIRVILDVPYADNEDARNKLDLYLPDLPSFPVVVFAHGGTWVSGDKALYSHLGSFFARNGIGAALINYRLKSKLTFSAQVQDLARAFAWTHRHITLYGGMPDRLFVAGHSSGGHLVSLLATDESFLQTEGLNFEQVRGVISISGVYIIHWNVMVCGGGLMFRGVDKKAASPFWNVGPRCPAFLILYAEKETWTLTGQARRFHKRLLRYNCRARLAVAEGENHRSIITNLVLPTSEAGKVVLQLLHAA
jgi:acetyl esterase/lipase